MNELVVKGKTKVCGIEVSNVYGGFGETQKVILAKTVSEIHSKKLKHVNELINGHINDGYFEQGIDFIDLKNSVASIDPLIELGMSKQSISNSANIYLLSQQGYTLLLKLMDSELARKQYKEVIRDYFAIKEAIIYLTQEDVKRLVARENGITRRNRETETISKFISKGEFSGERNPYALVTNATYDALFGMYAKEIKKFLDLRQQDSLRDFLSKRDLDEIREIEDFIHFMGRMGKTWIDIYKEMIKMYPEKYSPVKEEKSIKQLKEANKLAIKESEVKKLK